MSVSDRNGRNSDLDRYGRRRDVREWIRDAGPEAVATLISVSDGALDPGFRQDLEKNNDDVELLRILHGRFGKTKLTAKLPQSTDICHWHQDNAYYNAHAMSETRMSTWIPLIDADEENGCLWVVPRSHRDGVREHGKYGGQCPTSMGPADMEAEGAIPCPMNAGSILLFSSNLRHHSKGNATDQVRRAFIVSYQEATVPRGNADQWKILRGGSPASSAGQALDTPSFAENPLRRATRDDGMQLNNKVWVWVVVSPAPLISRSPARGGLGARQGLRCRSG